MVQILIKGVCIVLILNPLNSRGLETKLGQMLLQCRRKNGLMQRRQLVLSQNPVDVEKHLPTRILHETPDDGFGVVFYRHGTQKLSGIAQKTAQKEEKTAQETTQKEERINALLEYCKEPRDREEMMKFLGIKHRTTFRSNYLNPLLDDGKIAMTISDKPCSKNQKIYSV